MRWWGAAIYDAGLSRRRLLPSSVKRRPRPQQSHFSATAARQLGLLPTGDVSRQWTRNRRTCGGCPWAARKARGAADAND